VPNYLEQTLDVFVKNQEQLRENIKKSLDNMNNMNGIFPTVPGVGNFEEMTRKNMEMFENAMKMFKPFNMNYNAQQKASEKE
jgi:polyhydroxyalkanoate synthesis regulator protein